MLVRQSPRSRAQARLAASRDGLDRTNGPLVTCPRFPDPKRNHTLNASSKRVMGVHALGGVGGRGAPVGAGVNGSTISVNVPSQAGSLVLDVVFSYNSTTTHTAGAGQTERWNLNTTGGTNNLRGTGSSEVGSASTTMSWTSGAGTHHALLAVSYNPH